MMVEDMSLGMSVLIKSSLFLLLVYNFIDTIGCSTFHSKTDYCHVILSVELSPRPSCLERYVCSSAVIFCRDIFVGTQEDDSD